MSPEPRHPRPGQHPELMCVHLTETLNRVTVIREGRGGRRHATAPALPLERFNSLQPVIRQTAREQSDLQSIKFQSHYDPKVATTRGPQDTE